jgi:uncharacterized membrane protein
MSILKRWPIHQLVAALCLALLAGEGHLFAQDRSAVDEDGRIVDFQRDILPIFQTHCLKCHNEDEAKADFRIDDPESVFSYVEPEDLESSSLFVDYLLSDDPEMLMPPPSKGGPLSPQELSLVRVWIEEGAVWPEGVTIEEMGSEPKRASEPMEDPVAATPQSLLERIWAFQGFLHPATVHFPIALFLFGALFVVLGWFWPPLGKQIPLACLLLGTPTAIASTAMGFSFATEEGYGSWLKIDMDSELFWHRWSGVIVTVISMFLSIVALLGIRKQSEKMERYWKIGLLIVAGMVGAVGHQGGELSYGADFYPRAFRILLGDDGEVPQQMPEEVSEETGQPEAEAEAAAAAMSPADAAG